MAVFRKYLCLVTVLVYSLLGFIGTRGSVVCIEINGEVKLEKSSFPGACCTDFLAGNWGRGVSSSLNAAYIGKGECGACLDILPFQESQHNNINKRFSRLNWVAQSFPLLNAAKAADSSTQAVTGFYRKDFITIPQNISVIKTSRLLI